MKQRKILYSNLKHGQSPGAMSGETPLMIHLHVRHGCPSSLSERNRVRGARAHSARHSCLQRRLEAPPRGNGSDAGGNFPCSDDLNRVLFR